MTLLNSNLTRRGFKITAPEAAHSSASLCANLVIRTEDVSDGLYYEISAHAIQMAERLKALFLQYGYRLYLNSPTNQQFVILDNDTMEQLRQMVSFSFWEKYDETHTVVRFAVSWFTTEEDLKVLENALASVKAQRVVS